MRFTALLIILAAFASGCGQFRGIPSHGGGKRFDEEQRVVAGAIRQSVADMDLTELTGKRVQIIVGGVAHDGGGNTQFPGLTYISGGLSGNVGTGNLVQINQSLREQPTVTNNNSNNNIGGNIGFGYNPQTVYTAGLVTTSADAEYLKASLEMKAVHAGIKLVSAEPEAVLHVLVDVLGTNRSRTERFVSNTDKLEASCEATYYAKDAKSGELIFGARRVSAASSYREMHALGVGTVAVDRATTRTSPTPLPVHSTPAPSTAPVIAKRRSLFEIMLSGIAD